MTAQDPVADYAAWNAPESSLTVVYSLPLFHEIDFVVNEGYRRIPHGGLEVGGLLFGRKQPKSVQIEAFRPIECEHSTGPSFVLSSRDVEKLEEQLRIAGQDPELEELVPVGWFISHSRGELLLSDREAILFDQLFPHRNEITVLVKPIKFQPTRFVFLVRDARGKLNRDGTQQAIILPLAGRAGRASLADPAPSIAAPDYQPEELVPPPPVEETTPEPLPVAPPKPAVVENGRPAAEREPAPSVTQEEVRKETEPLSPAREEKEPAKVAPPVSRPQTPVPESKSPAKPEAAMPHSLLTSGAARKSNIQGRQDKNRGVSVLVSIFILVLAVALGFAIGYLAYSRLSFSAISLTVEDHPPVLFVSWPPGDSRDADSAAIRIDDGPPRPLTLQEKAGGQAEVKMNGNSVKIEILTHSWFHESRGIVRYVRPPEVPATTTSEPVSATAP